MPATPQSAATHPTTSTKVAARCCKAVILPLLREASSIWPPTRLESTVIFTAMPRAQGCSPCPNALFERRMVCRKRRSRERGGGQISLVRSTLRSGRPATWYHEKTAVVALLVPPRHVVNAFILTPEQFQNCRYVLGDVYLEIRVG